MLNLAPPSPTEEAREAAEQYARRCAEVNAVLAQCDEYLVRGMRTEAVSLAESPPPVLDAAAALTFSAAPAWREFCRSTGLLEADAISADMVARLNQAYVEEDSLGDLLAEYRRSARRAPLLHRIALLRRIARLDPGNPNWQEDLASLERARLEELKAEIPEAVRSGDLEGLRALAREMESPDWIKPPPPEMLQRVEARAQELRDQRNRVRAERMAKEVWAAYAALDEGRTGRKLGQWDRFLAQEGFAPPAEAAQAVAEAREWHGKQIAARREEAAFEQAQMRLSLALERGAARRELESSLHEVERFRRPVPDALRRRAERAIEDARLAEGREFRLKVAGVALAALFVAAPVLWFVSLRMADIERRRWATDVRRAVAERRYDDAASLLDALRNAKPALFAESEFQELAARVAREGEEQRRRREAFAGAMEQLEGIREEGFPPGRPYARLEQMAESMAVAEEDALRLEQWRIAKRAHEERLREAEDARFRERAAAVAEGLRELAAMDPEADPEAYERRIASVRAALERARLLESASAELRAQLPLLQRGLQEREAALAEARARLAEQAQALARLADPGAPVAQRRQMALDFLREYPGHPERLRIERLVRDGAIGEDLERALDWTPEPTAEMLRLAEAFLEAGEEAAQSLWKGPLERVIRLGEAAEKAPQALAALRALRDEWNPASILSFVAEDRRTGERTRYYFQQPFSVQRARGEDGAMHDAYMFRVFAERHRETLKVFSTGRYRLDVRERLADNMSPQMAFVQNLVEQAEDAPPWALEAVLLQNLAALRRESEISPFLRAHLAEALLELAKELTFENGPTIERALGRLEGVSTDFHWMDPDPDPETTAMARRIERALEAMAEAPRLAALAAVRQKIHRLVLTRRARAVGLAREAGGRFVPEPPAIAEGEMWAVWVDAQGLPAVSVVRQDGGALAFGEGARPYDSMPLFAPGDGRTTESLVEELEKIADEAPGILRETEWPRPWPRNVRGK